MSADHLPGLGPLDGEQNVMRLIIGIVVMVLLVFLMVRRMKRKLPLDVDLGAKRPSDEEGRGERLDRSGQ